AAERVRQPAADAVCRPAGAGSAVVPASAWSRASGAVPSQLWFGLDLLQGNPMSFGSHLRALREEAALSRAGLARRVGVPASTLRNWEGDRGLPGLQASLRLAEALGVPVERLAEGVEDPAGEEGRSRQGSGEGR